MSPRVGSSGMILCFGACGPGLARGSGALCITGASKSGIKDCCADVDVDLGGNSGTSNAGCACVAFGGKSGACYLTGFAGKSDDAF